MRYAIIVAGGKGLRMGTDVPKQFLLLSKVPILMRTIERFRLAQESTRIVLALPKDQQDYWQRLTVEHRFHAPVTIVDGGRTRFHSVKNALNAISRDIHVQAVGASKEADLVAVHDGVRPLASADLINRMFLAAGQYGAAVPVVDVVETLRQRLSDGLTRTVSRKDYCLVQTPQTFRLELLMRAYGQPYEEFFTDDASVVEHLGEQVQTVRGERQNIKITTPFDMLVAEAALAEEEVGV